MNKKEIMIITLLMLTISIVGIFYIYANSDMAKKTISEEIKTGIISEVYFVNESKFKGTRYNVVICVDNIYETFNNPTLYSSVIIGDEINVIVETYKVFGKEKQRLKLIMENNFVKIK